MVLSTVLASLGEWDQAQNELTDPAADGPRPAINRALCDAAATTPGNIAVGIVSGAAGPTVLGKFCEPYWDSKGGGPVVQPPFQGGQCAVLYNIEVVDVNTGGASLAIANLLGPISSITVSPQTLPQQAPTVIPVTVTATGAGGSRSATLNFVTDPNRARPLKGRPVRAAGGVDNCGDPPPTVTPPPNYPTPRPFNAPTTVNIGGDNYSVTIGGPETDINGDVYFPINIGGDVVVNVPASDPTASPRLPDNPPTTEGDPIDSDPGTGDVMDEVPPDEQGFIAGYCWQVIPKSSTPPGIPFSDPVVWPNVIGNLRLNYTVGGSVVRGQNVEIDSARGCLFPPNDKLAVVSCTGNISTAYGTLRLRKVKFGG